MSRKVLFDSFYGKDLEKTIKNNANDDIRCLKFNGRYVTCECGGCLLVKMSEINEGCVSKIWCPNCGQKYDEVNVDILGYGELVKTREVDYE